MPNLPAALQSAGIWCQPFFAGQPLTHAVIGPTSALFLLDAGS